MPKHEGCCILTGSGSSKQLGNKRSCTGEVEIQTSLNTDLWTQDILDLAPRENLHVLKEQAEIAMKICKHS